MTRKEKSKFKIELWKEEIVRFENELEKRKEQSFIWKGSTLAHNEDNMFFNESIRTLKKALNWNKLNNEERKEALKKDKDAKPVLEISDEEGLAIAQYLKPIGQIIYNRLRKAEQQANTYGARVLEIKEQIVRFKNLIKNEEAIDWSKESETVEDMRDKAEDWMISGKKEKSKNIEKKSTKKK